MTGAKQEVRWSSIVSDKVSVRRRLEWMDQQNFHTVDHCLVPLWNQQYMVLLLSLTVCLFLWAWWLVRLLLLGRRGPYQRVRTNNLNGSSGWNICWVVNTTLTFISSCLFTHNTQWVTLAFMQSCFWPNTSPVLSLLLACKDIADA